MVENEEMEEEEAGGGDVDEEEVKRELEWLEFEGQHQHLLFPFALSNQGS